MEGFPLEREVRHRPVVSCNAPQCLPQLVPKPDRSRENFTLELFKMDVRLFRLKISVIQLQSFQSFRQHLFLFNWIWTSKELCLKKKFVPKRKQGEAHRTKQTNRQTNKSLDDKCFTSFHFPERLNGQIMWKSAESTEVQRRRFSPQWTFLQANRAMHHGPPYMAGSSDVSGQAAVA